MTAPLTVTLTRAQLQALISSLEWNAMTCANPTLSVVRAILVQTREAGSAVTEEDSNSSDPYEYVAGVGPWG